MFCEKRSGAVNWVLYLFFWPRADVSTFFNVVLIGRPNVGKSTLFNRLTPKGRALVTGHAGTTRDVFEGTLGDWGRLFDTPGLEDAAGFTHPYAIKVLDQADVCLFMVDGPLGLLPEDTAFAKLLRQHNKKVVCLVNKCEGDDLPQGFWDVQALGFGDTLALSALEGRGIFDLQQTLKQLFLEKYPNLKNQSAEKAATGDDDKKPTASKNAALQALDSWLSDTQPLHIAIVGRPNVGKSTLVNQFVGEDRMLTGPVAGLTRDAVSVPLTLKGRQTLLWDTAGLARKDKRSALYKAGFRLPSKKIDADGGFQAASGNLPTDKAEQVCAALAAQQTLRAIRFSHVVIVVMDTMQAFEKQDHAILNQVLDEGRALVVAFNKWDTVSKPKEMTRAIDDDLDRLLPKGKGAFWVPLCALEKKGLPALRTAILKAAQVWAKRITTGQLNNFLKDFLSHHAPPIYQGKRPKIRYMTQIKSRPPTFCIFGSSLAHMSPAYQMFMLNTMRGVFGLKGTPLRLLLRNTKNPYNK